MTRSSLILTGILCLAVPGIHAETKRPPDVFAQARKAWMQAYNNAPEDMKDLYAPNSLLFTGDTAVPGNNAIADYFQKHKPVEIFPDTVFVTDIIQHDTCRYIELGRYETANPERPPQVYITAWRKQASAWVRELDVWIPATRCGEVPSSIDTARACWVGLANRHNPEDLVAGLYTADAIYFNRGIIDTGHREIARRYSYMASPDFAIALQPEHVVMVRPDTALETGQYLAGEYNGYYVLVWERQEDASWKAILDFNF